MRPQPHAVVEVEPSFAYRCWWSATEPLRLLTRLVVELWLRRSKWMLLFQTARLAAHLAIGSPVTTVLLVVWLFVWPTRTFALAVVVVVVGVEVWLLVARWRGSSPWLLVWRLAWKFHRTWPRVWADTAARTGRVQAQTGGEHNASVKQRPVVDHPRMSWRFWMRWPVVSFRVGVAPGRTFTEFERVITAMAANMAWVQSIELEYGTDRSSFGLAHVSFLDVLAKPAQPTWLHTNNNDDRAEDDGEAAA